MTTILQQVMRGNGQIQEDSEEVIMPQPEDATPPIMAILKKETGAGEIDDYLAHPLNFNGSKALAQVVRGITGFFGGMRYAIVDVIIGTLRHLAERGKNA